MTTPWSSAGVSHTFTVCKSALNRATVKNPAVLGGNQNWAQSVHFLRLASNIPVVTCEAPVNSMPKRVKTELKMMVAIQNLDTFTLGCSSGVQYDDIRLLRIVTVGQSLQAERSLNCL